MFIGLIIGISLSMDAFSLSLSYGTLMMSKKRTYLLASIVGLYHFFMPLLGLFVGKKIVKLLQIKPNTLVFIILFLIGMEMIIESFKENNIVNKMGIIEMFTFGLAVSIDSFSLGFSLKTIYHNPYILVLLFSILSFIFTVIGLNIGRYVSKKMGPLATIFGGFILIIISFFYLV